jgi:single-stranded-DNA-specific exonuclease
MAVEIVPRRAVPGAADWVWPQGTHRVLRQVLSRRSIASPDELDLRLQHLTPVGEFNSLQSAVSLLCRHRSRRIVIVGDFDADGATSTAAMWLGLGALGFADVDFFIPDRFALGYGLTPGVIERLSERPPSLIVTVDNGISSVAGVQAARKRGIEVLITDHHLPPRELPPADAIVNPNLPGDPFRGKHLAGVGVAFYLLAALGRALGDSKGIAELLDLVALGTTADLVALDHGNRILIKQGIDRIRAGRCRPGLRALCEVAGASHRDVTATMLAYQIAPRLNAAGRLDDMTIGVRCLVTDSDAEALRLAKQLDELNRERRRIEARMRAEAAALVDAEDVEEGRRLPNVVCLCRDGWHEGLVGLVASRIKERHHRPVFAFAPTADGKLKGSGRSVPGFHLRDALAEVDSCHPGLIERFGGHAMAAGLTLQTGALGHFRAAIERIGQARLGPDLLAERILTDGTLEPSDLTVETAALLRDAGPWGQGFPEPCFEGRFELAAARRLKDLHLKMSLRVSETDRCVNAIAFNRPDADWPVGEALRLVYRLAINDYFGAPELQLVVEHIEPADGASGN